jgi:hypothetical protein
VVGLLAAMNRPQANVWSTRPARDRQLATLDLDGTIGETSASLLHLHFSEWLTFRPLHLLRN